MTAHPTPDVLALLALGEDVDAEVLEHIAECRICWGEVDSLQQVVAIGRDLGPDDRLVAPHPRVWQRITEEVDGGRVVQLRGGTDLLDAPQTSSPATGPGGGSKPDELAARRKPTSGRPGWATTAVAAAAALVVGLGGGFVLKGLSGSGEDVVTSTQLNALPSWPGASGTATVETGPGGERTLVVDVELPATISVDGTMEVWMSDTRARDMIAMGTMSGGSNRFPVPAGFDFATHPIVDVSMEPRNDTDPHHSDISVVRGRLNV